MNLYLITGRLFLGICLTGIGVLHFFFPGIRPLILPDSTDIPSHLYWIVYLTAILLIGSGILICVNKKLTVVSLIIGMAFFLLFLFGHLPAFLSADRADKLKYWVNLNKTLALSGGFLMLASVNIKKTGITKPVFIIKVVSLLGRYFFAIMLFLFGLGHLLSTASLSALVPSYIPFAKFWTFVGGIILMGSAVSIFIKYKMDKVAFVLAVTLFIWLITLHLYYSFLFPTWQQGENFIGSLTCLAFCGTALLISQSSKINPIVNHKREN
jgi:uncharacterized membrane protein